MITVKQFIFNNIEENTYVLNDETKECVIIDPGCNSDAERHQLKNYIESNGLKPVALLNTHCHFDHIFGNAYVGSEFAIDLLAHKAELYNIERAVQYTAMFGMTMEQPPMITRYLEDGEVVKFGNTSLQVIHTPGHTPGCICFYSPTDALIVTGDTLFRGSIGRTDLPGGDYDDIMDSLLNKLMKLPGNTKVYCGHGPETEIGYELIHNPFITEKM